MQHTLLGITGSVILSAGLLLAQAPAEGNRWAGRQNQTRGMANRFADLNLTADQKQQAHTIFSDAREQARGAEQQLRQMRQELNTAVKNGVTADIDRITNSMGPLLAQVAAIHSKASAKFYAMLTPEQRAKAGDHLNMMGGGFRNHTPKQ